MKVADYILERRMRLLGHYDLMKTIMTSYTADTYEAQEAKKQAQYLKILEIILNEEIIALCNFNNDNISSPQNP